MVINKCHLLTIGVGNILYGYILAKGFLFWDFYFFEDDIIRYGRTRHRDQAVSGNFRIALWEMVVFSAEGAIPLIV